jgi:tRNA(Ile)-lysidine synthase
VRQALTAGADRLPCVAFGDHAVRVWRGRLHLTPRQLPPAPAPAPLRWRIDAPLDLAGVGRLWAEPVRGAGLRLALLGEPPALDVRFRADVGGDSVRKRLQELAVPPWQRAHWPLLFRGDRLLLIAGRAPVPADRAEPGEAGVRIVWRPLVP